ncbi:MAG TPA: NUDIX domain-containing protein [Candidatus Saccharimonadales bacterium]|nr:NUDIX domain-containing protein [Candidatus Saccharimonadales bacterium]
MSSRPFVGIGVLVQKDGRYLFGKRITKHGQGTWSVPGGHLEYGESFEECAAREVMEETGVKIKNIGIYVTVNNIFRDENTHSITVFMLSDWDSGEPKVTEPDKFIDIGWYDLKKLPKPLFLPIKQLQKAKPELFK